MKDKKRKIKKGKVKSVKNFRFSAFNADTHEVLGFLTCTRRELIMYSTLAIVGIIALFYVLIAFTPIRNTIPGYPDARTRRTIIQNKIRVDSLQRVVSVWELYSENILRALNNESPIAVDSIVRIAAKVRTGEELSLKDSIIRQRVRGEEQFSLSGGVNERVLPIEGVLFFTPVRGVISQKFSASHNAIDIATAKGSVIKSVLDGTVTFAGYTEQQGYVVMIQHEGDIISVYKHASKILKDAGNKVSSGTPIAIVGSTGSLSSGDHLHLEIWYKGSPVNPELYINF
ncbi:MAG: M23 family metallopeptidase [Bacteroidales bacterium]|nr:M23 family metallopeptidase [Bacteroidales bacterium]